VNKGKRVILKCHSTINKGEIRFGRKVEEQFFGEYDDDTSLCSKCGETLRYTNVPDKVTEKIIFECQSCNHIFIPKTLLMDITYRREESGFV